MLNGQYVPAESEQNIMPRQPGPLHFSNEGQLVTSWMDVSIGLPQEELWLSLNICVHWQINKTKTLKKKKKKHLSNNFHQLIADHYRKVSDN